MAAIDESKARRGGHATNDPGDDEPTVLKAMPLLPPRPASALPPPLKKAPSLPPPLRASSLPPPPSLPPILKTTPPPLPKAPLPPPPRSGIYTKGASVKPVVIPPNRVPVIEPILDADADALGSVEDDVEPPSASRPAFDWARASDDRVDLEDVLHRVSLSSAPPPPPLAAHAVPPPPPPVRFAPLGGTFDLMAPRPSAPPPSTLRWPLLAGSALLLVSVGVAISPMAHPFLPSSNPTTSAPDAPEVSWPAASSTAASPAVVGSAPVAAPAPSTASPAVDAPVPVAVVPSSRAAVVPSSAVPPSSASNVVAPAAHLTAAAARPAPVATEAPADVPASPEPAAPAAPTEPVASTEDAPAVPAAVETAPPPVSAEAAAAEPAAPAVRDVDHLLAGAVASTEGAAITSLAGGAPAARVSVPVQPSRAEVLTAMRTVHARVRACSVSTGPAILRVTFGSDGAVTSAVPTGALAGTAEGQCMAEAVRSAHVSPFSRPSFSIDYPFTR